MKKSRKIEGDSVDQAESIYIVFGVWWVGLRVKQSFGMKQSWMLHV
jgi:hypothetical protein